MTTPWDTARTRSFGWTGWGFGAIFFFGLVGGWCFPVLEWINMGKAVIYGGYPTVCVSFGVSVLIWAEWWWHSAVHYLSMMRCSQSTSLKADLLSKLLGFQAIPRFWWILWATSYIWSYHWTLENRFGRRSADRLLYLEAFSNIWACYHVTVMAQALI